MLSAPSLLANLRPTSKAFYSSSLLDPLKSKQTAYLIYSPSGLFSIKSALDPSFLDAPYMYSIHPYSFSNSSPISALFLLSWTFTFRAPGISNKKSARAQPLILVHVWQLMSCSPNSMEYFSSRSNFSDVKWICLIGKLVKTTMRCTWGSISGVSLHRQVPILVSLRRDSWILGLTMLVQQSILGVIFPPFQP